MKLFIQLFGGIAILIGIFIIISPETILGWMEENKDNTALYISAIAARLILGIIFILAAKESKFPVVIKILGFLFIVAAVVFVIMGQENFQNLLTTIMTELKPYSSISGVLSVVFGGFLIYGFRSSRL